MRILLIITILLATQALNSNLSRLPDLYNTGVDDNGNPLPQNVSDPHYFLISSADSKYPGPDSKVVLSDSFPMNCWIPNSPKSKWIAPRADAGSDDYNAEGVYVYRIIFDLSKYKSNTAIITGLWSTDNNGIDILINGKSTGHSTPSNAFRGIFPFEINLGFIDGINTLDFVVHNLGAPTGLRVEITGMAESKEYVYLEE